MNYSRRGQEFPRAGHWSDRAPNCPVGGTEPSGALLSSTLSLFLPLFSFAPFGLDFIVTPQVLPRHWLHTCTDDLLSHVVKLEEKEHLRLWKQELAMKC
jgi:hypothetical protein